MEQYIALCEITRHLECIMSETKGKWYAARVLPTEQILRYSFVTQDMLKDTERLSNSI